MTSEGVIVGGVAGIGVVATHAVLLGQTLAAKLCFVKVVQVAAS